MIQKIYFLILIISIYISSCNNFTNSYFSLNKTLLRFAKEREIDEKILYLKLVGAVFDSHYKNCSNDLDLLNPLIYDRKTILSKYPHLINYMGKALNDLGNEIECINSLINTQYLIFELKLDTFINKVDRKLLDFLNLTTFCIGICSTDQCVTPLKIITRKILDFANVVSTNNTFEQSQNISNVTIIPEDKYEESKTNFKYIFEIIFLIYIIIKLFFGIIVLIWYPKGYDKHAAKFFLKDIGEINNPEENEILYSQNRKESLINLDENSNVNEYHPNFDLTSSFPKKLRVIRFLDFFNDVMLLTTKRNRYYNDNGLESINFVRSIILYFLIFSNTFNSLFALPSKDILNKSFFTSYFIFIYRLSIHSLTCWIFLEAAYTTYKLMKFINVQMFGYHINNNDKNFYINLIIIYGKFLLLFIPKILMFLFYYYIFYYNIIDFMNLFSAKTTFEYIVKRVINKDIKCSERPSLIFSFLTFIDNVTNFKTCYDFTFIYYNILFSTLIFMILLYLILIIRKPIFEIIIIIINMTLFIGLMFTVKDSNIIGEQLTYTYYHFKGQEYTTKIFYISLGVYHLGFILGILCFNYDCNKKDFNRKKNKKKNRLNSIYDLINENNNENNNIENNDIKNEENNKTINFIDYKLPYYPLSFLNKILKWVNNIKFKFKVIFIFICFIIMYILSIFYKLIVNRKVKTDINYLFEIELKGLKYYFLFEGHIFILLFFFINLILITFNKRLFYKKIFSFKLTNAISRTGFTITCLYSILGYFFFCGFLVKIKFNIITFFLISIGNFLIIFILCFLLNIIFELPLRIIIKKILRLINKDNSYSKYKKDIFSFK